MAVRATNGENAWSIAAVLGTLRSGRGSAADLLDGCLARIDEPDGEGRRVFLRVYRETAKAAAAAMDRLSAARAPLGALGGIPVSIKDLFDVAGEPTTAGSRVLADAAAARKDATVVQRLRAAGAVIVGRTNMTEFAYSGIGMNPHFGTPCNAYGRAIGLIPGGSSSGAAVSVTDRMAVVAIGTDTGGSCRIPAALCGLTGFKPTASRIPTDGVLPLSKSFDSVGVLAPTVACVALVDAVLAGERVIPLPELAPARVRLLIARNTFLEGADETTGQTFDLALSRLSKSGVRLVHRHLSSLEMLPELLEKGGIVAAEAYAWHEALLASRADGYDPRVRARIMNGGSQTPAFYNHLLKRRAQLQASLINEVAEFDAIVAPATPIIAPPLSTFASDTEYTRLNTLLLRNPSVANMVDGCAVSIPCHEEGAAPVGLMLIARRGTDRQLLAVAAALERELARTTPDAPAIADAETPTRHGDRLHVRAEPV